MRQRAVHIYIKIFYLLFLGVSLGGVLTLGAFVASVIFNSQDHLATPLLSHFNEGLLMGEIFNRFSYFIYLLSAVVITYELFEWRAFRRDKVAILSALAVIGTSLLFSAVYSPKILQMQSLGVAATTSEAFDSLHKASELDFKLLALALSVLFFRRAMLLAAKNRP